MMGGWGATPYDLPDCEAVDAPASRARRVGASAVLVRIFVFLSTLVGTGVWMMGGGGACAVLVPCMQHPIVGGTDL
jgi:hypothetical protein